MAQDYIEYEFTRKDGTRVYEMVSREDAAREMLAFQKMHDAASARPASENPLRLVMQAVLGELTDAAIDMEGAREEVAAAIRRRLHEALIAGNHLHGAKVAAAEILNRGFETDITPTTWHRLQDEIARESDRELRVLSAQISEWDKTLRYLLRFADGDTKDTAEPKHLTPAQVARIIRSVLHGWGRPRVAPDDLRDAVEALCRGRLTRDHTQRIRDAIDEAEMI